MEEYQKYVVALVLVATVISGAYILFFTDSTDMTYDSLVDRIDSNMSSLSYTVDRNVRTDYRTEEFTDVYFADRNVVRRVGTIRPVEDSNDSVEPSNINRTLFLSADQDHDLTTGRVYRIDTLSDVSQYPVRLNSSLDATVRKRSDQYVVSYTGVSMLLERYRNPTISDIEFDQTVKINADTYRITSYTASATDTKYETSMRFNYGTEDYRIRRAR